MAQIKKDEVKDKILASAKNEFLEKGFQKSSLRSIVKKANLTQGAMYAYFKNKDDLFFSVVKPAIDNWSNFSNHMWDESIKKLKNNKAGGFLNDRNSMIKIADVIYSEYDLLKLLILKSNGSKYENYLDDLILDNYKLTSKFIDVIEENGYTLSITRKEYFSFLRIYWKGIFEVVEQEYNYDEALVYLEKLTEFLNWQGTLNVKGS